MIAIQLEDCGNQIIKMAFPLRHIAGEEDWSPARPSNLELQLHGEASRERMTED